MVVNGTRFVEFFVDGESLGKEQHAQYPAYLRNPCFGKDLTGTTADFLGSMADARLFKSSSCTLGDEDVASICSNCSSSCAEASAGGCWHGAGFCVIFFPLFLLLLLLLLCCCLAHVKRQPAKVVPMPADDEEMGMVVAETANPTSGAAGASSAVSAARGGGSEQTAQATVARRPTLPPLVPVPATLPALTPSTTVPVPRDEPDDEQAPVAASDDDVHLVTSKKKK